MEEGPCRGKRERGGRLALHRHRMKSQPATDPPTTDRFMRGAFTWALHQLLLLGVRDRRERPEGRGERHHVRLVDGADRRQHVRQPARGVAVSIRVQVRWPRNEGGGLRSALGFRSNGGGAGKPAFLPSTGSGRISHHRPILGRHLLTTLVPRLYGNLCPPSPKCPVKLCLGP